MIIIDLCVFNNAQWNDDDSGTTFERVFRNYTTPLVSTNIMSSSTGTTTTTSRRAAALRRAREILNLSSSFGDDDDECYSYCKASIDRAFRKHALRAHPDKKNGSAKAFNEGKWAKEVLMRRLNGGESFWDDDEVDDDGANLRKPTYDWKRTRETKKTHQRDEKEVKGRRENGRNENGMHLKSTPKNENDHTHASKPGWKLRTLHEKHTHAVTVMSVLKREGDGCVFIASGDAGGEVFIYEKKSKRILNVDTGGNKGKFGAVAALEWNIDENTRRRAISLAVTFAKGFDAHVYEFHPLDLSVKSKAVLRETHLKRITCCAFHKGVLVLGSADGTSSVWMKDCDSTDEARYMKNASISRDASNEWARKRMLRHHFDKGAEAMPKSAITSTLIHFSDEEKNILHIVTCDASGRFKVWEGDTGHLEKIAKIHEVNWSGCGGIVKAALMRQKKTATVIGNEKHYLVTSHFDSNSNISRALCWDAFVRNAQTAIRGYVHEYPKKDVPFYGRLSSVDFFAPSRNETKSMKNITKIDPSSSSSSSDDASSSPSSSSLGAFVVASTLTVVDTSTNTLLFTLELPSTCKRAKISPDGLLVACALTTGQISIVSVDDAEEIAACLVPDAKTAAADPTRGAAATNNATKSSLLTTTLWTLDWLDPCSFAYANTRGHVCEVVFLLSSRDKKDFFDCVTTCSTKEEEEEEEEEEEV